MGIFSKILPFSFNYEAAAGSGIVAALRWQWHCSSIVEVLCWHFGGMSEGVERKLSVNPISPISPISFMDIALGKAQEASLQDEVPVGCVIVKSGQVISVTSNKPRQLCDATAHAEILAIREACQVLQTSRLDDCEAFVTLEPCAMCGQAFSLARLQKVTFGAYDPKGGALIHGPRLYEQPTCLHRPLLVGGVQEQQARSLLKNFFRGKRSDPGQQTPYP